MASAAAERNAWNRCRFRAGTQAGHYESWFLRGNHPSRPLAFWIRYTIFSPKGGAADAVGELWAVWFDGERHRIVGAKEVVPISACSFSPTGLDVRIGSAMLHDGYLEGHAVSRDHSLKWSMKYDEGGPPLLLLPRGLYDRSFPKAKALVGAPNATFRGALAVDGETESIEGWRGSQNHNWGSRHTDSYAWGQVAGFDGAGDTFLECSTAQLRIGPVWTPPMSLVVLRTEGHEYAMTGLATALRARGRFEFFDWHLESHSRGARVKIHIHAPRSAFIGLSYANPPGWTKTCLNTKLAACELTLERRGHAPRTYRTADRAAFEILTDRDDHGVPVVV